ncbi:2013_t:CDS:1, partial [Dentiscutata heterogama]
VLDTSLLRNGIETWLKSEDLIKQRYKTLTLAYTIMMESLITMFLRRSEILRVIDQ